MQLENSLTPIAYNMNMCRAMIIWINDYAQAENHQHRRHRHKPIQLGLFCTLNQGISTTIDIEHGLGVRYVLPEKIS